MNKRENPKRRTNPLSRIQSVFVILLIFYGVAWACQYAVSSFLWYQTTCRASYQQVSNEFRSDEYELRGSIDEPLADLNRNWLAPIVIHQECPDQVSVEAYVVPVGRSLPDDIAAGHINSVDLELLIRDENNRLIEQRRQSKKNIKDTYVVSPEGEAYMLGDITVPAPPGGSTIVLQASFLDGNGSRIGQVHLEWSVSHKHGSLWGVP